MIFDVGDRAECAVKRRPTSTPLQALVLLNDPQYVEAARVLAENLILKHGQNPRAQLQSAFKLSTGRSPDKKELEIVEKFHQEEQQRFIRDRQDALAYIQTGSSQVHPDLDPSKVAALATVINGITNSTDGYTIR